MPGCASLPAPPPPSLDAILDRVIHGIKDTTFEESTNRLVGMLGSKYRRPGTGVYSLGPANLVQSFVKNDKIFNYNCDIPETAGIVETWKVALEICKRRTLEREKLKETMFYLSDYSTK